MEKKRILFISQEITPYLPETEMSKKGRFLPQGIQEHGREIRTFMPRYGSVNERRNQLHEVIRLSGMNLVINDADHPLIIKVASIQAARMQVYFIDNEDYFHRKAVLKDSKGREFDDNDERAVFFARGVLETVIKLRWAPDLIHCHGWLASLVPLYIKKAYHDDPLFEKSKVVYSVYDESFKKPLSSAAVENVMIDGIDAADVELLKNPTYENMMKLGVQHADAVIQGSETINPELAEYIAASGKLNLGYQAEETYIDAYNDFYDKVL
ncbi:glycogen/starch synthase [Mangrovibacterium marinum]|uniref:starch synthase n=1 Tax=Mangrovibacterium marinum TaxID=1639118 RepID=A0A2T5C2Q9_9BACT|nr:glycogen/starch synthase [Mangrovibacterium marinum]PTN09043.1 starch synthase [Mangrovibacterium marinum]